MTESKGENARKAVPTLYGSSSVLLPTLYGNSSVLLSLPALLYASDNTRQRVIRALAGVQSEECRKAQLNLLGETGRDLNVHGNPKEGQTLEVAIFVQDASDIPCTSK